MDFYNVLYANILNNCEELDIDKDMMDTYLNRLESFDIHNDNLLDSIKKVIQFAHKITILKREFIYKNAHL